VAEEDELVTSRAASDSEQEDAADIVGRVKADQLHAPTLMEKFGFGAMAATTFMKRYDIKVYKEDESIMMYELSETGQKSLLLAACEVWQPGSDLTTVNATDFMDYLASRAPILEASSRSVADDHSVEILEDEEEEDAPPPPAPPAPVAVSVKEVFTEYSRVLEDQKGAKVFDLNFTTKMHIKCKLLQESAIRASSNTGLFSRGGYHGTPREVEIVCMGCKTALSAYYVKYGSEKKYAFCWKEQGARYPASCIGISACTIYLPPHTHLLWPLHVTYHHHPLPHPPSSLQ
jgi:hypothetical protein